MVCVFIIYFFILNALASSAGFAFAAANPHGPIRTNPYSGKTMSEKRQIFTSAIQDIVSMNAENQMAIERFCNEHGSIEYLSLGRMHQIRFESFYQSSLDGVFCTARSTRVFVPKGDVYAMEIVKGNLKKQARKMDLLQSVPEFIRCRWTCFPPAQIEISTEEYFAGKKKRRNVIYDGIAIEYFDGVNLREWLEAQSQGLSQDQRANVFHTDHIKRAYERAKRALFNMWKQGWIHRHMNVDHFRYQPNTDDIRMTAANYELVTKRSVIPTLDWMELICEDFKDFSITFMLAVLSPERGSVHAPSLSLQSEASVITQKIVEEFDPEIQVVQAFLEKDALERSLEDVPASLRLFAASPASSKSLLPYQVPEHQVASPLIRTRFLHGTFVLLLMLICFVQRTWRFGSSTFKEQLLECEEI